MRKKKAESRERNQIAKLFDLVVCCFEHVKRGETSTVKCSSILLVAVSYP